MKWIVRAVRPTCFRAVVRRHRTPRLLMDRLDSRKLRRRHRAGQRRWLSRTAAALSGLVSALSDLCPGQSVERGAGYRHPRPSPAPLCSDLHRRPSYRFKNRLKAKLLSAPAHGAQLSSRVLGDVQRVLQIEQWRALRGFLAVRRVQHAPGRAPPLARVRQHPARRPALPEDLADHRRRRHRWKRLGGDLVESTPSTGRTCSGARTHTQ